MSKSKPVQIFGVGIKRIPSEEVHIFGPWTHDLVDELIDTCAENNGVGLAAPQLGVYQRVIVAKTNDGMIAVANPKIIARSKETYKVKEGCLSLPGLTAEITRHESVTVMAQQITNSDVKPACTFDCSGLAAQIFQHECDHLDGLFFIDHLSRLKRNMIEGKMRKFLKNAARVNAEPHRFELSPSQRLFVKRISVTPR
jgi:peptide deformylase